MGTAGKYLGNTHYRLTGILPTLLFLILCSVSSTAQEEDLYLPPVLTIDILQDGAWLQYLREGHAANSGEPGEILRIRKGHCSTTMSYLLPIIFFDQGSGTIPSRYQQFNSTFETDSYSEADPVDLTYTVQSDPEVLKYYEVLNILGSRMNVEDSVTIELQGTWSVEAGEGEGLARERAEVVADYLKRVWRIDPARISVLDPFRAADSLDNILAQEEARSVRIYPSHRRFLKFLEFRQTHYEIPPVTVVITLDARLTADEVTAAELVISAGDDVLGVTRLSPADASVEGETGLRWIGLWQLPRRPETIGEKLSFDLTLNTAAGNQRRSNRVFVPIVEEAYREYSYRGPDWETRLKTEGSFEYRNPPEPRTLNAQSAVLSLDFGDGLEDSDSTVEPKPAIDTTGYPFENWEFISFFSHDDTVFGRLQLGQMESVEFVQWATEHMPTSRWRIQVSLYGDLSLASTLDPARLAAGRLLHQQARDLLSPLVDHPGLQTSLYVVPPAGVKGQDEEDVIREIINAMYTDEAVIRRIRERRRIAQEYEALNLFRSRDYDSYAILIEDRSMSYSRQLAEMLDPEWVDSLMRADPGTPWALDWLPEGRFYQRGFHIKVYNQWTTRWWSEEM